MIDELLPLQYLAPGQTAHIEQLLGDPDCVHRLEEMGMRVGDQVEMVQSGRPCIVMLRGHRLCIRDGTHFQVLVRTRSVA